MIQKKHDDATSRAVFDESSKSAWLDTLNVAGTKRHTGTIVRLQRESPSVLHSHTIPYDTLTDKKFTM